jgi:hypothetical protein
MKIVKSQLLKAMWQIRNEYKEKTHNLSKGKCALCKLYLSGITYGYSRPSCTICPMNAFWADGDNIFPCMNRKCEPIDCVDNDWLPEELQAVIEFYKRAINAIGSRSAKELNEPLQSFIFLREIDRQVAKEYGLNTDEE